jgi:hypothetical protein
MNLVQTPTSLAVQVNRDEISYENRWKILNIVGVRGFLPLQLSGRSFDLSHFQPVNHT